MIIRARPRFLLESDFKTIKKKSNKCKGYYFNSGRAALKAYLLYLNNYQDVKIAMQSFNCNVVCDAALQAQSQIYLLDVKLNDFSVSLEGVKACYSQYKINVLLLTHYQGFPNIEYKEIISFCKKNGIKVIEDLAQTKGSTVYDIKVGTLGDVILNSFAFDKPLTCMYGGELIFNSKSDEESFKEVYNSFPIEKSSKEKRDIDLLKFLLKYSKREFYNKSLNNYSLVNFLNTLSLPECLIFKLIKNRIVLILYKIAKRVNLFLSNPNEKIMIERLGSKKIKLLKLQEERFNDKHHYLKDFELFIKNLGISMDDHDNLKINWNRYSIIDQTGQIKKALLESEIEVGNFNWPRTLQEQYSKEKSVTIFEETKNSKALAKNIINIPIWSSYEFSK